jgi:FlaA1/EpsC-like NDP-sugar epimerase
MNLRKILNRLRTRSAAFTHDLSMIPVAWLFSYWLRFNLAEIPGPLLDRAWAMLPVVMAIQGCVFWYFGLYRGVWRFASVPDLIRIVKAVVVGTCTCALVIFLFTRMVDVPRSVFPLYGILLVTLLGGPRLVYRWIKEHQLYDLDKQKVLVVGAGSAGEMLVRDLYRDRSYGYAPVAFVDDDPAKKGREIHGLRVAKSCDGIPVLAKRMGVDLIIIALPSATSRQMRRVVGYCEQAGVPFRTLPRMQDVVAGRSVLQDLREVSIVDLLGREPVSLDWSSIKTSNAGRTILVSGGGGSIGAELCRQIAALQPRSLVILDNGEFNLYSIEMELRGRFPGLDVHPVLADVCHKAAIEKALQQYRPDVVFHAAAYKHVPMLEPQVSVAVRNNFLGTRNLARAAVEQGIEAFVLISTDKAVNPANVMGASKRLAEVVCQDLSRREPVTRFITVRFGNVLDSAGSVVPLFRKQIAEGGPVTVTHPEVRRYFMTIPEACQLILEAGAIGKGGEIFVLDMGDPIRIGYLAEQMVVLAGKTPGEDVEIAYTGLRPGEKLNEELFDDRETLLATEHDKILLARSREMNWSLVGGDMDELARACEAYDESAVQRLLGVLVPEFAGGARPGQDNIIELDKLKR